MKSKRRKKNSSLSFEIEFYEKLLKEKPDFEEALIALAENYTKAGELAKGLELDEKLSTLRPQDALVHYNLACSYSLTGRIDEAFTVLRRAIKLGYNDFKLMDSDPDLTLLRKDQRYNELVSIIARKKRSRNGMGKAV